MADLPRDDRDEGRTATSTGPHTTHGTTHGTTNGETHGEEPTRDRGSIRDREPDRDLGAYGDGESHREHGSGGLREEDGASSRLLDHDERSELRERWDALQGRFVDDPSGSTHLADELMRDTRERIARGWEERHRELTDRWEGRDDLTTEDLRTTLRRYRDVFEQLLSSS